MWAHLETPSKNIPFYAWKKIVFNQSLTTSLFIDRYFHQKVIFYEVTGQ